MSSLQETLKNLKETNKLLKTFDQNINKTNQVLQVTEKKLDNFIDLTVKGLHSNIAQNYI